MLYNITHALAVNVEIESVLGHSSLTQGNLLWPCSLIETSDTELRSRKVSYLKSRVRHWSGEKQRRHDATRALLSCYVTNQLTNTNLVMLCQRHCYGPCIQLNIYTNIYIRIRQRASGPSARRRRETRRFAPPTRENKSRYSSLLHLLISLNNINLLNIKYTFNTNTHMLSFSHM